MGTPRPPEPTARQKRLTLIACIAGSAVVFIDGTVVQVALPAIREDIGGGLAAQQWVIEAYLLTLASLLLIGGSLSDLFGRRRVFALGAALFGLTSLMCAAAPTTATLIGARALQGVAGALLVPSTLATIMAVFPPAERGRAIGSWTAWSGVSTVIGPLAGGALVDAASWRWIFALNVIPVALTLYLVMRALPAQADVRREHRHVDWTGAVLAGLGLGGPVFALIEQPARGWGDPLVLGTMIGGLALLAGFILQERRSPEPMMPLDLFRRRNFAVGNAATLAIYAGLGAAIFFTVVYLQQTGGYSALEAGLALMPITVIMFFLSSRFGALADRIGPRLFMGVGPLVGGAGLLTLVVIDSTPDYVAEVLPGMTLFGLGLALTVAPLTATVLGDADENHSGIASGINNAVARVAGLLAIAAVGAFVAAEFGRTVDEAIAARPLDAGTRALEDAKERPFSTDAGTGAGASERPLLGSVLDEASVDAFRLGIGICGGLMMAGGLISLAGIRNPRRTVAAAECPGGAICGASEDVAHAEPVRLPARVPKPARA